MAELITIQKLQERTELPLSWLYAQTAAGKIPHLKLGKYLRFEPAAVDRWLEAHRRGE
jgi:excisionase family DNA binding protein